MDTELKEFIPNRMQREAKARFSKQKEELSSIRAVEQLSIAAMAELANAPRLTKWASIPGFMDWWLETDTAGVKIKALEELAIERLEEILCQPLVGGKEAPAQAKDVLKAIEMLLQLSNRFPAKNKEIRFLDKSLDSLDSHQVQKEIESYQLKLAGVVHVSEES
jgi:hypothetical protein